MAVITGNNVRVYKGGTAIAYATTCTVDLSVEFIELAPDSGSDDKWRRVKPRRASGTVSVSALYSEDDALSRFDNVFDDLSGQSGLTLAVQGNGFEYDGSAYVESVSLNAGAGQIASWTANFIFSGEVSKTSI